MKNLLYLKIMLFCSLLILMTGCPMLPSSRIYKTLDWETSLYQNSTRCIFPNDIKLNKEKYLASDTLINWVGIIKKFNTRMSGDTAIIEIILDQKYWDYVEDFSVQDERMFISPHGEGEFLYIVKRLNITQGTLDTVSMNIRINDLGICYGQLSGSDNGLPTLKGHGIRFIPYKYYSTKIMSYKAKKDSITGETICDENNMYKLTDFNILKIAGSGQNK